MSYKLAFQAVSWYNRDRILLCSEDATNILRTLAHLSLKRRCTMDSLFPHAENSNSPTKPCKICGNSFPLTSEFFTRDKKMRSGFINYCKTCESEKRKIHNNKPEIRARNSAHQKAYNSRPKIQEQKRAYRNRSEVRERQKARYESYKSNPEKLARKRAHNRAYKNRPEIRARNRANQRIYMMRPEIRERYLINGKVYRSRSETQERKHIYFNRPEIQERVRFQQKTYHNRPEIRERDRMHNHNRRARKRAVKGTYTSEQIQEQLKRQKHKCYYCSVKLQKVKKRYVYHIDHTFPLSRVVGTDIPANDISYLVLTCPTCNMRKRNKFPHEFYEGGKLL
jgi:hypothetical protein